MTSPQIRSQQPSRRARRPPRISAGPGPSYLSSSQDAELSADTAADKQVSQPIRILRRGEADAMFEFTNTSRTATPPPETPPRPKSMYAGAAKQQQQGNDSAPETPSVRMRTPKAQGRKQSGQMSPLPMTNGTPVSVPRRESLIPNRTNETPTKAYAGPTFHASPAASSLPIPKFYSKSVPNVEKTKTLKTMMEQEAPGSSSGSEPSPLLEKAQPVTTERPRQESPLDIFFRADKEAKGRVRSPLNCPSGHEPQEILSNPLPIPQASSQHHSRPNSVGGMFALELDGASTEVSNEATLQENVRHETESHSSATSTSTFTEAEREEHRKAQTIALKKLLNSPRPQLQHNGAAGQRPPSSKLRSEISLPTSPEHANTPELPATPAPFRLFNTETNPNSPKRLPNGYIPSQPSLAPSAKKETSPILSHDMKSIENDLRRILKLDILGSDGVRS